MTVLFGQLVIGPAGSGKTTFCNVMAQHLTQLQRNVIIVNIDPANDVLPYNATIDINDLIKVTDVMENLNLGPNGALMYCMDFLETNFDWLLQCICEAITKTESSPIIDSGNTKHDTSVSPYYLLFDCPGQSELYTHHYSFKNVINKLVSLTKHMPENVPQNSSQTDDIKTLDIRLAAVNIVDSHYANEPAKFISVLMNSLSTMIHLEMPHVNVLGKMDLFEKYGKVHFGLDFYCEILDLEHLVNAISDDPFFEKYKKLTKALAGVIEDYSLVSFLPLDINNDESVIKVLRTIDKANGFYLNYAHDEHMMKMYYNQCEASDFDASKYGQFLEKFS